MVLSDMKVEEPAGWEVLLAVCAAVRVSLLIVRFVFRVSREGEWLMGWERSALGERVMSSASSSSVREETDSSRNRFAISYRRAVCWRTRSRTLQLLLQS